MRSKRKDGVQVQEEPGGQAEPVGEVTRDPECLGSQVDPKETTGVIYANWELLRDAFGNATRVLQQRLTCQLGITRKC